MESKVLHKYYIDDTDYSSTIFNSTTTNTWECPYTGILTLVFAGQSGGFSTATYLYIRDLDDTSIDSSGQIVGAIVRGGGNYNTTLSFLVEKGHHYYKQQSGIASISKTRCLVFYS